MHDMQNNYAQYAKWTVNSMLVNFSTCIKSTIVLCSMLIVDLHSRSLSTQEDKSREQWYQNHNMFLHSGWLLHRLHVKHRANSVNVIGMTLQCPCVQGTKRNGLVFEATTIDRGVQMFHDKPSHWQG